MSVNITNALSVELILFDEVGHFIFSRLDGLVQILDQPKKVLPFRDITQTQLSDDKRMSQHFPFFEKVAEKRVAFP